MSAETVRELMRRSGGDSAPLAAIGLRVVPPTTPKPLPAVDPAEFTRMRETLDYLRLEPQERAKREAEPLVAVERIARESAERSRAESERVLAEHRARPVPVPEATEQLRAFLAESEVALAAAQVDVRAAHAETTRIAAEAVQLRAELHTAQAAAFAASREHVVYREAEPPQNIDLDYQRDANGLLAEVVMRATGYGPVRVGIVRGGDNRVRALKLRR